MLSPIKRVRLEQGRQQFQVAAACGLHPARLSLIETGRARPRPDELQRLADVLGVSVTALSPQQEAAA
jgi:transcriptional regulator with XRE-family HTH domain